jgi:DNA-binding HxlR family transcriptional regulator/putative sterol carrier protein
MAGKRHYDDGCATAHALELIGERWALLVVRELMLGPKRFGDLRRSLPGISPNVLTQRLQELEAVSIVVRRRLPPPASVRVYDLTAWGRELEPLIRAIGRWAARSPTLPMGRPMSVNSLVLSFRTMFDPAVARGFEATIALRLDGLPFRAEIAKGKLEIEPGDAEAPDAEIEADPNALAQVVYGGMALDIAVRAGDVRITGDRAVVERFVTLFPLPAPAPVTAAAD